MTAQNDEWDVPGGARRAQPGQKMLRVAARHGIVRYNDGGLFAAGYPVTLRGVGGVQCIDAARIELDAQKSLDILVIIDQQYAGTRRYRHSGRAQSGLLDATGP